MDNGRNSLIFCILIITSLYNSKGLAMGSEPEKNQNDIQFNSAEIAPDGNHAIFSYKYEDLFHHIAVIDINSSSLSFTPIHLPPNQEWLSPTFSRDMKYIAAVSYCEDKAPYKCHEGIYGYSIWRLGVDKPSFERITPMNTGIRRTKPVFGRDRDTPYYIISDTKEDGWASTYIATSDDATHEHTIFPERLHGTFLPKNWRFSKLQISNDFKLEKYAMLAVLRAGPESLMKKIEASMERSETYLFYNDGSTIRMIDEHFIDCFTAADNEYHFIYAQRDGFYSDISTVFSFDSDGKSKLFSFDGRIVQISASDDCNRILYLGRTKDHDLDVWLYDRSKNTQKCLFIRELIKTELPILMQKDRAMTKE